jgi:hypothetical protein
MRRLLAGAYLASLIACGGTSTTPSGAVTPSQLAGVWTGRPLWTLQVLRISDNFTTSFTCAGSITLTEGPFVNGVAILGGFAVAGSPCAPVSFDLTGTVQSDGTLTIITGGPPPTEGPCPGGNNISYTGQVTGTGFQALSARGVTTVQCPQFGEHRFTYLLAATHSS